MKRKLVTIDDQYMGIEPVWSDVAPTQTEIIKAYSWYNYFFDRKDSIKLLFDNYPRDKKEIALLKRLGEHEINNTLCYQARMISRGCKIFVADFNQKIDALILKSKKIKEIKLVTAPKPTVRDRVVETISDTIAELEETLDTFTRSGFKSDFNMYNWLKANGLKSIQSKAIVNFYSPLLLELQEAKKKTDADLTEAYKNFTAVEMNRYITFVAMIVNDATAWATNQKTIRKVRVKKAPSVEKVTSKVKYLRESVEYQLASISPATIIGAQQLWVFNTKYRTLTRYDAFDASGLKIQGTTIKNYNETSLSKTVRKPQDILKKIVTGSKSSLKKIMDEIKSVGNEPTGRINENTILLKVIK